MASSHQQLVSPEWLRENLENPKVRVVDATVFLTFDGNGAHTESGLDNYNEAHIPGAVFIDQLTQINDHGGEAPFAVAPSETFAEVVGAAGISNENTVVIYDTVNGIWATRLWWHFGLEGHDDVKILDGGLAAWTAAGHQTTGEPTTVTPTTFTANRRADRIASTSDVEAAIADDSTLIINVLDRESFAGGRIPSSVNLPFPELVDEAGKLRDLEELRPDFEAAGALNPDVRPITYCGGGIAATAVAFALIGLGRDDVAVYDGSLNAWTSDESRPLETA